MGFFGGFAQALGDESQKNLDQMRKEAVDEKSKVSDLYWKAVQNPEVEDSVREHAFQQLEDLYKDSPKAKAVFKQLRDAFAIGKSAHDTYHAQPGQELPGHSLPKPPALLDKDAAPYDPNAPDAPQAAPAEPSASAPPAPAAPSTPQAAAGAGLPAPPSINDVMHGAYPSAEKTATVGTNAALKARKIIADAVGLSPQPGEEPSTEFQRLMATGTMPASTSLQLLGDRVPGTNVPQSAVTTDGKQIDPNGFYRLQREPYSGTIIATAAGATAGQVTPQRITYKGPNGQHVMGWAVNGVYQDDQHKPLAPGTEVFDPGLQAMTTVSQRPVVLTDASGNQSVGTGTSTTTRRPAGLPAPPDTAPAAAPAGAPAGAHGLPAPPEVPAATGEPAAANYNAGAPPDDLSTQITSAARAVGLDTQLALAVANQESRFNNNAVSAKGARGLFQLMPETAKELGVDPSDPAENIFGGVKYLSKLVNRYTGDIPMALAAYNWGAGNVDKAITKYGEDWLSHAPAETQDYVQQITGGNAPTGGGAAAGGAAAAPQVGISNVQPLLGPDGVQIHKPLSAAAKNAIGQATITMDLMDQIMPELDSIASAGGKNQLWDSVQQRSAWQQYLRLGIDPANVDPSSVVTALPNIDPRLAKLFPTIAMLQVVGAQPWLRNIRRFEFLQQVQQHLPDPEKDAPELMLSKLDTLSENIPNLQRAAYEEEGITVKPFKKATVAEVNKYATDSGQTYADVAHTLRRGGYKITRSGK